MITFHHQLYIFELKHNVSFIHISYIYKLTLKVSVTGEAIKDQLQ